MFDKNYKLLDAAWEAVDPTANQVGASPVIAHDYLMREYTAKEEDYVFMYVSNENATLVDVYFDDIIMTHTKSNVIQYNEYYPYGLQTANSWTRENTTGNQFLANGGTELNTLTALYDLDFRNYDPILGRLLQVDPLADKYSSLTPYNYAFNMPVNLNDPTGADPYTDGWETGRSYGTLGAMERILPNTSADDFIRTALNSPYGGMWGSTDSYLFTSDEQTFAYGVAYNDYHNSWSNTEYGSEVASRFALTWIKATGEVPLQETVQYHLSRDVIASTNPALPWIGTYSGTAVGALELVWSLTRVVALGSISLLGSLVVSDTQKRDMTTYLTLGTIAPGTLGYPLGHSILGIGWKDKMSWFHLAGTKYTNFTVVSPARMAGYVELGMMFDSKIISVEQWSGAMSVIGFKLNQGTCDYNKISNSCVSNIVDIMRGAGFVVPQLYRPMELRSWFVGNGGN